MLRKHQRSAISKIFLASGGAAQAAGAMARPILVFTIHHVFAAPFQIRSRHVHPVPGLVYVKKGDGV